MTTQHHDHVTQWRWILKVQYRILCALSIFMVIWILILPSSWLMGHWQWHDDTILATLPADGIVAPSTIAKMSGHTAVALTHLLPGAIWVGVIPFQLHSENRRKYPRAHRYTGYIFMAAAMSSMVGVVIIFQRGLLYIDHFQDLPPLPYSVPVGLFFISLWFSFTAGMAVYKAKNKRFQEHEKWIYRHVASGIWVVLQRIILIVIMAPCHPIPVSRMNQRAAFGNSSIIAIIITVLLAEYSIYIQMRLKTEIASKQQ